MNWNTLTLKQYQDIYPVITDETLTDLDKVVKVVSIILQVSEDEIDSLPLTKLKEYKADIAFLFSDDIPRKVPKYIHIKGKRYRFVHEIQKMPAARYIEAKTYSQPDLMANLHKVMASCVIPQRRAWYGRWVDCKYDAADHPKYAADMLDARFVDVYNCVVFFYLVFAEWMHSSKDYLTSQFRTIMPEAEATGLVNIMVGSFPQPKSPNTSA